jgi:hypothetical protein
MKPRCCSIRAHASEIKFLDRLVSVALMARIVLIGSVALLCIPQALDPDDLQPDYAG